MVRRSVAVAIAVTVQQLIDGKTGDWSFDQQLVLDALRRSTTELANATDAELGDYLRRFDDAGLKGITNNVKGKYHELLVQHLENADDDGEVARLFEATNHPGADIEFVVEGEVIREVQLKAVQDPAAIIEHFAKYPDIDVMVTSEVFETLGDAYKGQLEASGFSNEEVSKTTRETLEHLAGEDLSAVMQDGVVTSLLVGGALQAKAILSGQRIDAREVRSTLEMFGVGAGTAFTVDTLLNLA